MTTIVYEKDVGVCKGFRITVEGKENLHPGLDVMIGLGVFSIIIWVFMEIMDNQIGLMASLVLAMVSIIGVLIMATLPKKCGVAIELEHKNLQGNWIHDNYQELVFSGDSTIDAQKLDVIVEKYKQDINTRHTADCCTQVKEVLAKMKTKGE